MTDESDVSAGIIVGIRRVPARVLIFGIDLYRTYVSPTRMPTCRFTPTCSEYAVDALRERGAVMGLGLIVVRLLKCAPWHPGGWDPVPPRGSHRGHGDAVLDDAVLDTGKQPHDPVSVGEQRST